MAEMMVTCRDGKQVKLRLWRVDRGRQRVGIDIPDFNARLIFTKVGRAVQILAPADRQRLDPEKSAILHVSESVYRHSVQWAGSILNSPRREG